MKIATTLEEILKGAKETTTKAKANSPDTYEEYLRKNNLYDRNGYANAVSSLYASTKRGLSSYGINNRKINNKGLQNSGYASYLDDLSESKFNAGLYAIKNRFKKKDSDALTGYAGYLDKYADNQAKIKKNVMTHLVKNGIVDLSTAVAYGISAGLSEEDANEIGKSAYEVTKDKVFNNVLEQTVKLGLDSEGARLLAIKMGVSESDAREFANEIGELLDYYGNISEEYLEFLEQRGN